MHSAFLPKGPPNQCDETPPNFQSLADCPLLPHIFGATLGHQCHTWDVVVFFERDATGLVRNECGEKCEKSSVNQICTISNKDWYRLVGIGVAQNLPKSMEVFDLTEMEPEIQIKYIAWCICSKIRDHIFSEPLGSSGGKCSKSNKPFPNDSKEQENLHWIFKDLICFSQVLKAGWVLGKAAKTREREFNLSHMPQDHTGIEPGVACECTQSTNLLEEYQCPRRFLSSLLFCWWIHWTQKPSLLIHDSHYQCPRSSHILFSYFNITPLGN